MRRKRKPLGESLTRHCRVSDGCVFSASTTTPQTRILHLAGAVPSEVWNKLGIKLIPKLRSGTDLRIGVEFSVTVNADQAAALEAELRQILGDLDLKDKVRIEKS